MPTTMTTALLLSASLFAPYAGAATPDHAFGKFEKFSLILETNQTDRDAEIVVNIEAARGLNEISLANPENVQIMHLAAKDQEEIGLSEILIETAEPGIQELLKMYPEGIYTLSAETIGGKHLMGTASLSHQSIPAPQFSYSSDEEVDSSVQLTVDWAPVANAAAYVVKIEQEETGVNFSVQLDSKINSLTVPTGFLTDGTKYEISVAAIAQNGNISVAEGYFKTLQ